MAPKTRARPADPDKDPWFKTQVHGAYSDHVRTTAVKGLGVEPASRECWMAVKGLAEAEVTSSAGSLRVMSRQQSMRSLQRSRCRMSSLRMGQESEAACKAV